MAHSCCRLPSTAEWQSLKDTLQKTLEFSTELTGAESGNLVLLDSNGVVTDSIRRSCDTGPDQCCGLIGQVLDKGIGGWVRDHNQVGLITDALDDDRWLPLPHQPQTVRSVLAVPIIKCDELLGILTLMHTNSNHFSPASVEQMQATSDQIAITVENTRLYGRLNESYRSLERSKQKIEVYSKALDEEMEKGKKIQLDFLPSQIPYLSGWDIAFYFHPAKQVSGDFYDAFSLPGDRLGLVIADVCDKGIGSALFMALFRSLIRVFSGQISLRGLSVPGSETDSEVLTAIDLNQSLHAVALTNDYIAQEHGHEGMFATLFFGVLDPATGEIAYINGGHEPLFIVNASGVKASLRAAGPAIGMMSGAKFKVQFTRLEPGDILIGYTDGVTEALSPENKLFTKKRFLQLLEQPASSASGLIEQIKADLIEHVKSAPQFDDITMIAVHRKP